MFKHPEMAQYQSFDRLIKWMKPAEGWFVIPQNFKKHSSKHFKSQIILEHNNILSFQRDKSVRDCGREIINIGEEK